MDHVGITVPDIDQATQFFEAAFDAELIYESKRLADEPDEGPKTERMLNLFPGTRVEAVRMMRLRYGPGLELFQMRGPEQHEPVRPSDYGLQHFAISVDDIDAAIAQFEAAGGTMFSRPKAFMFGSEVGAGDVFCYGRAPWGSVIEMLSYPSPMPYERDTPLRRWRP
jgi:catechol 2,3-dioxygenase-like lactoylglutathione lyase family enzyme